jgi:hypothetical protein
MIGIGDGTRADVVASKPTEAAEGRKGTVRGGQHARPVGSNRVELDRVRNYKKRLY